MLATVLAFLAKIGIGSIASRIMAAYEARAKAETDHERVAANERIKTLEARRDVLAAEAGSPINAFIRAGFALPFVIYNAKLVLWDKVLGWGTTDPLSTELFQIELAAIGFYFLYDVAARLKR